MIVLLDTNILIQNKKSAKIRQIRVIRVPITLKLHPPHHIWKKANLIHFIRFILSHRIPFLKNIFMIRHILKIEKKLLRKMPF